MDKVTLEIKEKIAYITINRPEKRNALNEEVRSDLYETLKHIDSRDDIRVAIITGAGDAFVAGADIAAMKDYEPVDAKKAYPPIWKRGNQILLGNDILEISVFQTRSTS